MNRPYTKPDPVTLLIALAAILAATYLLRFCGRPVSWPRSLVKTLSVALLALAVLPAQGPAIRRSNR